MKKVKSESNVVSPFEPAEGRFIAKEVLVDSKDGIELPDSMKQRRIVVVESALEGVKAGDNLVIEAETAFKITHEGQDYFVFGKNDYCAKWR